MEFKPEMRFYRGLVQSKGLKVFTIKEGETDLEIRAQQDLKRQALQCVKKFRAQIIDYIQRHPEFKTSLVPVEVEKDAAEIVQAMASAGKLANVGPMAAVAGAIAEFVGRRLIRYSSEIIVENGGDIFICSAQQRQVAIYAGDSPLSLKLGIRLFPAPQGVGVCTSSATIGPSLSLGKADAVVIIARSATLADAVATAVGNLVTLPATIEPALNFALSIPEVHGALIILGDKFGVAGSGFELFHLNHPSI
ncbi:MAG: UPF0280 family protein [Candidatus Sumerlaeia bacterium]|nr:UPF0280 family protein [Candidatus Sumerlaeia bacterium]